MKNQKVLTLLGDSIIDNKFYVKNSEYSVTEHIENISSFQVEMIAVDGDTTKEVLSNQIGKIQNSSTHIVLSVGGNDLLQNLDLLFLESESMISSLETSFDLIASIHEKYETIIENLLQHNAKILLCTVYEGDLESDLNLARVNKAGQSLLKMFNDTIYFLSNKYNLNVLELRNIFTEKTDYANPIEPSHIGGEKLANQIVEWVNLD